MASNANVLKRWAGAKYGGFTSELGRRTTFGKRMFRRYLIGWVLPILVIGLLLFFGLSYVLPDSVIQPLKDVFTNLYYGIAGWTWLIIIALLSTIIYVIKGAKKSILRGVGIAIVLWVVFAYAPAALEAAEPIIKPITSKLPGFEDVSKSLSELSPTAIQERITKAATGGLGGGGGQGPDFESRVIRDKILDLSNFVVFTKDPLRADFNVRIDSKEKVSLEAKCLLDGEEIAISESLLEIRAGGQDKRISCTGPTVDGKQELVLKLEGDFTSSSSLELELGPMGSRLGSIAKSKAGIEGPYSVSLETGSRIPFTAEGDYVLYVEVAKAEKNAKNKEIKSLKVTKISQNYEIICDQPFDGSKLTATRDEIDQRLNDKTKDNFFYSCLITVIDLPKFLETSYTIEKEFKQSVENKKAELLV